MLVESAESARHLFQLAYPEKDVQSLSLAEIAEVLQKDGTRIRRLKNYSQSQATKHAWRKKRANFMSGIKRYWNSEKPKDPVKNIKDRLKKFGKIKPFTGDKDTTGNEYESCEAGVELSLGHFDIYEFVCDLNQLETLVLQIAATFTLEEQFVESAIFADMVVEDLAEVKKCVLAEKPIPQNVFETLLILVEKDLFEPSVPEQSALWERYSKLIGRA